MHITVLALGSYGDVLPVAALGRELQAAGHQVRFATFENFEEMVARHGLDFHIATDTSMRQRAAAPGEKIREEAGIQRALEVLNDYMGSQS